MTGRRRPTELESNNRRGGARRLIVLFGHFFGHIIKAKDDLIRFLARGRRRENQHTICDRRSVWGGQPSVVLQFTVPVLRENGETPAVALPGDRFQDQRSMMVVLDAYGEAAIAGIHDCRVGDAGLIQEGSIVHVQLGPSDLDGCGGLRAAGITFEMQAERADCPIPPALLRRFAANDHHKRQQGQIGVEPEKASLHIRS